MANNDAKTLGAENVPFPVKDIGKFVQLIAAAACDTDAADSGGTVPSISKTVRMTFNVNFID